MAAGSGAIPHPAVSFYTCPTSILTILFRCFLLIATTLPLPTLRE